MVHDVASAAVVRCKKRRTRETNLLIEGNLAIQVRARNISEILSLLRVVGLELRHRRVEHCFAARRDALIALSDLCEDPSKSEECFYLDLRMR